MPYRLSAEILNAVWKLVVEEGLSHAAAARALGIPEQRVDHIIVALYSRRNRLTADQPKRESRKPTKHA